MQNTRWWLLPVSWPYCMAVWLRNRLYSAGLFKSVSPSGKTIVVGNLALGGTGKTPHTDYLLSMLPANRTAALSRGYGRATRGFREVAHTDLPELTGDEPLLLARKHPDVVVAVDENRLHGIAELQRQHPGRDIILFDDALQHRRLRAGFNLLLTTWQRPFNRDAILPAGNLRDHPVRARDADAIVITKTPANASPQSRLALREELSHLQVPVFFSQLRYSPPVLFAGGPHATLDKTTPVLLVTALADSTLFKEEASKHYLIVGHHRYRDHHHFTMSDIQRIRDFIGSFAPGAVAVLTTEKDAMRLLPFVADAQNFDVPIYTWEIKVEFGEDAEAFNKLIEAYVAS